MIGIRACQKMDRQSFNLIIKVQIRNIILKFKISVDFVFFQCEFSLGDWDLRLLLNLEN